MWPLPGACVVVPAGEAVDGDDEADGACVSGLARSLRQRLEEERKRTEEAEAELDRQRASNAGLGASLSRLEAQLAAKKAFWEVHAHPCPLIFCMKLLLSHHLASQVVCGMHAHTNLQIILPNISPPCVAIADCVTVIEATASASEPMRIPMTGRLKQRACAATGKGGEPVEEPGGG